MKENGSTRIFGWFYGHVCKRQMKKQYGRQTLKAAKKEYRAIIRRAKDIGPSRLMSAYCMAASAWRWLFRESSFPESLCLLLTPI